MTIRSRESRQQRLTRLTHEYMQDRGINEIDLDDLAAWLVESGRYRRTPPSIVQLCKRELSAALRNDYFKDPQGRDVRRMHPARYPTGDGKQLVIWADLLRAKPNHMRVSMQQRRQAILADARQHKTDLDSYNDNNIYGVRLPLFDYDFNKDLAELEQPTSYPSEKPGGADDAPDDGEDN